MKIAVISDIHANLPALEVVYAHALKQNVAGIYCLGDLVNQNVWNNEVVDFMRAHNIQCLRGNHDEGIGNNKTAYPFALGSREEEKYGLDAVQYTLAEVTDDNKCYLRNLPDNFRMTIGKNQRRIFFAHGSSKGNNDWIYHFLKADALMKYIEAANTEILIVGNTHCSFHKTLKQVKDGRMRYRHIINPGSVGCPKDGGWHACYAVLNIDENKDVIYEEQALQVTFYRLDYDISIVIKAIQNSPLHIYYAMRFLNY